MMTNGSIQRFRVSSLHNAGAGPVYSNLDAHF